MHRHVTVAVVVVIVLAASFGVLQWASSSPVVDPVQAQPKWIQISSEDHKDFKAWQEQKRFKAAKAEAAATTTETTTTTTDHTDEVASESTSVTPTPPTADTSSQSAVPVASTEPALATGEPCSFVSPVDGNNRLKRSAQCHMYLQQVLSTLSAGEFAKGSGTWKPTDTSIGPWGSVPPKWQSQAKTQPQVVCDALAGKHLWFIGDEYLGQVFASLVNEFGDASPKYSNVPNGNLAGHPVADEKWCGAGRFSKFGYDLKRCGWPGNVTWSSESYCAGHGSGAPFKLTFAWKTFVLTPDLDAHYAAVLTQQQPDAVFLSFGRHGLAPGGVRTSTTVAAAAASLFQDFRGLPLSTVVWVSLDGANWRTMSEAASKPTNRFHVFLGEPVYKSASRGTGTMVASSRARAFRGPLAQTYAQILLAAVTTSVRAFGGDKAMAVTPSSSSSPAASPSSIPPTPSSSTPPTPSSSSSSAPSAVAVPSTTPVSNEDPCSLVSSVSRFERPDTCTTKLQTMLNSLLTGSFNKQSNVWQPRAKLAAGWWTTVDQPQQVCRALAGKHIYILGDSFSRELFVALVEIFTKKVPDDTFRRIPSGDIDLINRLGNREWCDPERSGMGRYGLAVEKCGRPANKTWLANDYCAGSPPGQTFKISYQFKTYMSTPFMDGEYHKQLKAHNPDLVILNTGRWGTGDGWLPVERRCKALACANTFLDTVETATNSTIMWLANGGKFTTEATQAAALPRRKFLVFQGKHMNEASTTAGGALRKSRNVHGYRGPLILAYARTLLYALVNPWGQKE